MYQVHRYDIKAGAELRRVDFTGAILYRACLIEANLEQADLSGTDLTRAQLMRANLKGANLRRVDLTKANLKGANLEGADLAGATCGLTNFEDVQAFEVNAPRCLFHACHFKGADFEKGIFILSDFQGSRMDGVNFQNANLYMTKMLQVYTKGTNFSGANTEGMVYEETTYTVGSNHHFEDVAESLDYAFIPPGG